MPTKSKTDKDERTAPTAAASPRCRPMPVRGRTCGSSSRSRWSRSTAWIAADFLTALAWAIVIAITTWPLYVRFAALIPQPLRRIVAPLLFTLLVGIVLLIPLMLALQQLAQASDAAVRWVAELQKSGVPVPAWIAQLPFTGDLLVNWWQSQSQRSAGRRRSGCAA